MRHNSSLVCMVGITYLYTDMIFAFYGYVLFLGCFFFYPSLLISWMFEHDCLDTCCFWVSYMHVFCIYVFAPVQHS